MTTDIVWNNVALDQLLEGPLGPVARDLARRAIRVETAVKVSLNNAYPPASMPGSPPHKRHGRLQSSISWELGSDGEGLYADIGTNVEYGRYLELGTDQMAARPYLRPALTAANG